MSINGKTAFNNAKKFCNNIVFLGDEKERLQKILDMIYTEIKYQSSNGKVNYKIFIPQSDFTRSDEHLTYIIFKLREKNFAAKIMQCEDDYVFNISV